MMGYAGSLQRLTPLWPEGPALPVLRFLLLLLLSSARPGLGQEPSPLEFNRINQAGFGGSHNTYSWSMAWYKGNLYVGTNRDFACVQRATEAFYYPILYPYKAHLIPFVTCAPNPYDLDLRAEIWRYSPATASWNRVYQSPADLPNPLAPGKFVARDIGYRGMVTFTEPDGTEALYVLGTAAREYIPGLPPPRILRSTDGVTFTPIPQDPGTMLGDLDAVTFRASAVYGNRLFITAAPGLTGDGVLLESSTPALGNDSFRQVVSSDLHIYELNVFNGLLYIGAGDKDSGYSVWKTDATGEPPYALNPVVTGGAGRGSTMASVVSMHVFNNRLYVGSASWYPALYLSCEMIRINTDDYWQVVVGDARWTPTGYQYPLSGLPDGFGNPNNAHIWRMEDHQGVLYAGTNDSSWSTSGTIVVNLLLAAQYGFDLFSSGDGQYWNLITQNAFGATFDYGCRSLTSTPLGLFLGSADDVNGTGVWLGTDPSAGGAVAALAAASPSARTVVPQTRPLVASPSRLAIEIVGATPVVSWDAPPGTSKSQVFRAEYQFVPRTVPPRPTAATPTAPVPSALASPDEPPAPGKRQTTEGVWVRGPFAPIGTTDRPFFRDTDAVAGNRYAYYARAEDREGRSSAPSNAAATSFLAPGATFESVEAEIRGLIPRQKLKAKVAATLLKDLERAREAAAKGDPHAAQAPLEALQGQLTKGGGTLLTPNDAEDLETSVSKLRRRVGLAESGILTGANLLRRRRPN